MVARLRGEDHLPSTHTHPRLRLSDTGEEGKGVASAQGTASGHVARGGNEVNARGTLGSLHGVAKDCAKMLNECLR